MRSRSILPSALVTLLVWLPACAASHARQKLLAFQEQLELNTTAWMAARDRLKAMCPPPPSTLEDYEKGKALRLAGADPFKGCDVRVIKLTNSARTDDWQWAWAPPYQTIVAIHEEELRKRVNPKLYEEYMMAISRYLAEKADQGEITPIQIMGAFNKSWLWMYQKTQEEGLLLQDSIKAAELADAAAWNTFSAIAAGLAIATTAALVASAPYPSQPTFITPAYSNISCQATPGLRNTVTGQLYGVTVYCR